MTVPEMVGWTIAPVVQLIQDHLAGAPSNLAVIGDELHRKGDPHLASNGSLRFFQLAVYRLLFSGATEAAIGLAIQGGQTPWMAPGLLTSVPGGVERLRDREDLELEDLHRFADYAAAVYAGGYDDWGFVVWTRGRSAPHS